MVRLDAASMAEFNQRTRVRDAIKLVLTAKVMAVEEYFDETCASYLHSCEMCLRNRYPLSQPDESGAMLYEDFPTVNSFVRLLEFIRRDLSEDVGDAHCVALMDKGIHRFRQVYSLSDDSIYEPRFLEPHH
jgi:hypothetical protein